MSYSRDPKVDVRQPRPIFNDTAAAGPLATTGKNGAQRQPRRVAARSRVERVGFWIVVVAAIAVLLLVLGAFLPPLVGGLMTGTFMALFVGGLSLMNLRRPSNWANITLGRKVFPVLSASDNEIWRLAGVNAALTFAFAFLFEVLSRFVGPFFGGLLVFAAIVAAAIFYNRARSVIIKP